MDHLTKDKRMWVYDRRSSRTDIFCFSTTRHGGYSEGNYASFNCNHYCGDNPEKVEQNRELLCSLMPVRPKMLVVPHQTHGTTVRVIDDEFIGFPPEKEENCWREWMPWSVTRRECAFVSLPPIVFRCFVMIGSTR